MFVVDRRRGTAVVALLLGLGLLSACSGSSDSPQVLPPLSTTPAASASTAPAQNPKAAAVAVVREYYRLLNATTSETNADSLAALMTADCPCRQVVAATRRVAAKGQRYFGVNRIRSATPSIDSASTADVVVQYDYTNGGIKGAHGQVISRSPGRKGNLVRIVLTRQGQHWLIARIEVLRNGSVQ